MKKLSLLLTSATLALSVQVSAKTDNRLAFEQNNHLYKMKPKPKKTPEQACRDGGGKWVWTESGGKCIYPL